jgi:nitrogen PTS system EIIA component
MKLSDFLGENVIKTDLEAVDKMEAIEELIDLLISEHELSLRDRDDVIEVVFQREKSMSTGVGETIAIPHGSIDCIEEIVGAIGISKKGIDFESFDGLPAHIVILLLVPKTKFGKHIKTLAQIARTLGQEDIRNSICLAETPEDVLDILEKAERG